MAVFHRHSLRCTCGNTLIAQLADSVNVKRSPETRDRILRGDLHRTKCTACNRTMTVEKPFYYTDFARNVMFKVLPRGERHMWKQASIDLNSASDLVPSYISVKEGRSLRVVFGMDELREKLVAQDAGLDDRVVELLKVLLVYEHPILLRRPRLRLTLDKLTETELQFSAAYEHDPRRFVLRMPMRQATELLAKQDQLAAWTRKAHKSNLFELPDHWVNMWRWSPQPTALDRLRGYAQDAKDGKNIDTSASDFKQMLSSLPRGTHLPAWAKQDLRELFKYAKANNLQKLEDDLFEIRFGIGLEDDWSTNEDTDDIDTLWKLLKDLPDTNVEGNTSIHEILLDEEEKTGGGIRT